MSDLTPYQRESAVAVLKDVKALLEKGWTKWAFRRKMEGQFYYCIAGAVRQAIVPSNTRKRDAIYSLLVQELPPHFPNLHHFNDAPATTQADVVALVARTIAKLEAQA